MRTVGIVLTCGLVAASSTLALAVTLNDGGTTSLRAGARDTNVSMDQNYSERTPVVLPYSDTNSFTHGSASSNDTYNLSESLFHISVSHVRPARVDSHANSFHRIFFSVAQDTPYDLTGSYTAVDPTSPRHTELQAELSDVDTSTVLFHNEQVSRNTPNESLILGQTGGDFSNILTGSPTGTLLAGHRYQLRLYSIIYAGSTGTAATAAGDFSFAVPEPTALGGMAVMTALALVRNRRPSIASQPLK